MEILQPVSLVLFWYYAAPCFYLPFNCRAFRFIVYVRPIVAFIYAQPRTQQYFCILETSPY